MRFTMYLDVRQQGGAILEALTRPFRLFPDGVGDRLVNQPTAEQVRNALGFRRSADQEMGMATHVRLVTVNEKPAPKHQPSPGQIIIRTDSLILALQRGSRPGTAQIMLFLDETRIHPEWYTTWVKVNLVKRLPAGEAFEALRRVERAVQTQALLN